jgi:integrase
MPMGRRRGRDFHLPQRVYFNRGTLFYVAPSGQWHRLGKEWDRTARNLWLELTTGEAPQGTVAELLDAFLKHSEDLVRAGKRSPRTLDDNEQEVKTLKLVFGRMGYGTVTRRHVAAYLRRRADRDGKLAPIRANREVALLSSAYAWAMGEPGFEVHENPCYGVRRNPESPRTRYLQTVELQRFGRFAPAWLRCYLLLKRLTGLRQGDMLRLGRQNVTDRGLEVATGKTGKVLRFSWTRSLRVVVDAILALPMPARKVKKGQTTAKLLRMYFFTSRYGTRLSAFGFKSAWQRSMNAHEGAGFERFWEHDVRGKTGSDASSVARAQELLGHDSARTTARHYRRAPATVRPLK